MARNRDVHVSRDGTRWKVTQGGEKMSSHRTQGLAADRGEPLARRAASDLVIHGRDGHIRSKDSFGNDPNPPKDREH